MTANNSTFPPELQNIRQLMSAHGAYRLGAWHLLETGRAHEVAVDYSHPSVMEHFGSEAGCLCAHLNLQLAGCPLASHYLPLTAATLFDRLQDGVLLCTLANVIRPGTIDETLVTCGSASRSEMQVKRNLNLAICSLEVLGVSVGGMTPGSLRAADASLYVDIVLQVLRRCLLPKGTADEAALARWTGDQLDGVVSFNKFMLEKFPAKGLRSPDCEAAVSPDAATEMHRDAFAHNVTCLGLDGLVEPEHLTSVTVPVEDANCCATIVHRAHMLRLLFLARLRRLLEPTLPTVAMIEESSSAETTVSMWINSMGLKPLVHRTDVDLRDGLVLLQAWEVLYPGSIDWTTVSLPGSQTWDPQSPEAEQGADSAGFPPGWVTNCAQALACARQRGVVDEQSTAELLAAGDEQTTIALVLGMLKLHSLAMFQRAVDGCSISTTQMPLESVIDWANAQLLAFGSEFQLTGLEDSNLKNTTLLGYLGERILTKTGRLVSAGPAPGTGAASARMNTGKSLVGAMQPAAASSDARRLVAYSAGKLPAAAARITSLLMAKRLINWSAAVKKVAKGRAAWTTAESEAEVASWPCLQNANAKKGKPPAAAKAPVKAACSRTAKAPGAMEEEVADNIEEGHNPDGEEGPRPQDEDDDSLVCEMCHGRYRRKSHDPDSEEDHYPGGEESHYPDGEEGPRPQDENDDNPDCEKFQGPNRVKSHDPDDEEGHCPGDEEVHGPSPGATAGKTASKKGQTQQTAKAVPVDMKAPPAAKDAKAPAEAAGKKAPPAKAAGKKGQSQKNANAVPCVAKEEDEEEVADGIKEGPALTAKEVLSICMFDRRPVDEKTRTGTAKNDPPFKVADKATPPAEEEGIAEGQQNANASARMPGSAALTAGAQRMLFQQVSKLTSDLQAVEYWHQTLCMFRQCGVTVYAERLGADTDIAVFHDVLLQLQAACLLAHPESAAIVGSPN